MEKLIGKVKHFYGHIPAMVVELEDDISLGDKIVVRKKNGEERFGQIVESMEIERKKVESAKGGQEVAIQCAGKTKEGDLVYKVINET
ncbi:MAG: translation elongation factor-like protein [Candidatus Aenigmatarchaeota archaeon]